MNEGGGEGQEKGEGSGGRPDDIFKRVKTPAQHKSGRKGPFNSKMVGVNGVKQKNPESG